jgi:hypothetical protein
MEKKHPPEYLTDIHTHHNQTWWQSVTMLEDVHTQDINLTVNLGTVYIPNYCQMGCPALHSGKTPGNNFFLKTFFLS